MDTVLDGGVAAVWVLHMLHASGATGQVMILHSIHVFHWLFATFPFVLYSIESEETTVERIIRQKNGNGKASGNTASNKSKVEKAKEEASGGGSPISYDIDEFVEIFGHSIYNNGPENTYFQHFRNYIQLLTPTPAQYYSIDMKDKVYCFTNRASSDIENGLENDAELGNDDTSALLKPKHF